MSFEVSAEILLEAFVLYVVIPAWLCAGLADWACHRASHIEATSGTKESLLHIAQQSQVGLPLLAALFLEINALVIAAMAAALLIHQATAVWDVRWANATRTVTPVEQHLHSVLEMAPVMAFAGFAILNGAAVRDLLEGRVSPFLTLKDQPLPPAYLTAVLAAILVMGVVPYGEELIRCLMMPGSKRHNAPARRSRRSPR